jgi:hypothetical protein
MHSGLLFIITVEMYGIELDRLARKINTLVNMGNRTVTRVALLSTYLATVLLFIIAFTEVLGTTINIRTVTWFSLPLKGKDGFLNCIGPGIASSSSKAVTKQPG